MLTKILFALSLGFVGAVACFVSAFVVMASISKEDALTVIGYSQLVLIPAAGVIGLALGIVLCLVERGTPLERWLIGAGILCLLAIIVNGTLWLMFK